MSNKVKETSEELLIIIINFILESEADESEINDLFIELATSLVAATIDFDKDMKDICDDITQATYDIAYMAEIGIKKYKDGDTSNVKKIWEFDEE